MSLIKRDSLIGRKPRTLYDSSKMIPKDRTSSTLGRISLQSSTFNFFWHNQNEYEQALVTLLTTQVSEVDLFSHPPYTFSTELITKKIYEDFGQRKLLSKYFDVYECWDGNYEDMKTLSTMIDNDVTSCIIENRYKWGNLMKSMLLEFNPLWNVDGVEETTRTLEQDGTITNRKRGSDSEDEDITTTLTSSENDTTHKTGNDRTLTDESTSESHTGTVNRENDGDNLTTNNLSDTTTYAGSEINSHQIHTTAVESKTTTESETLYTASKVENTGAGNDNVDTKEFNNRTDTLAKGGTVREQISSADEETRNLADTIEHDNDVTTTYNTTDTTTRGASSSNVVDRSNVLTHNTDDTETRDLLDTERITHKRSGNIGITTTTKLLEEFRAYSKFDIVEIVAHDIANAITEGVY